MSLRSGFIGLIGRPNAGKSTLLNALVGTKVAIMTDKPQTTRNVIRAVRNDEDSQMVFMDTPGIHKPQHKLGSNMVKEALITLHDIDIVYLLVDATKKFGAGDEYLLEILKAHKKPVFLIMNKVDLLKKEQLIELLEFWQEKFEFAEIIPVSALKEQNLKELVKTTKEYLPDTVLYYPVDQVTDNTEQFMISEIIREKIIQRTEEEIPHSIAVIIEDIKGKKESLVINAMILVERDSQKGIIIGKNGNMIKTIGKEAREELELLLGKRIFLELFVRVEKNWRNRERPLKELGYSLSGKYE
jgi:GTP-binding protein Era